MFLNKQKIRINQHKFDKYSDDDNEFLDDFLKPPQKIKESSRRFHLNQESTIKLQHHSVPSKITKNQTEKLQSLKQTEINKQINQILKNIKKQEEIRREKTRHFLKKITEEKQEQKKLHEFRIAQRRIKKRLMLIERKQRLQEQLLSFVQHRVEEKQPSAQKQKEKAKSVDEVASHTHSEDKVKKNSPKTRRARRKQELTALNESQTSVIREKIQLKSTEIYLPEINNGSDVNLKKRNRVSRISTITFTKELRIEEDNSRQNPKYKNYLAELKQGKRRNYTSSNAQLERLYHDSEISKQKSLKAIELTKKIENKRRLKQKNINQIDFKQAESKIQLLSFLHKAQQQ